MRKTSSICDSDPAQAALEPAPEPSQEPTPEPLKHKAERIPPDVIKSVADGVDLVKPKKTRGRPRKKDAQKQIEQEKLFQSFVKGVGIMLSTGLGKHWQLDESEARLLATAWTPILEYYKLEPGIYLLWITAGSTTVGVFGPRLQMSIKQKSGVFGWVAEKVRKLRSKGKARKVAVEESESK